jgi:thioredoxin reductase (NADPH)
VTLLHRRTTFRADAAVHAAMRAAGDVEIVAPVVVEELVPGDDGALAGLRLRNLDDGTTRYHATDGLFIAIGHLPASEPFADWLRLDASGGIVTSPVSTATSLEGVFAAGDVADARYRQAVTAAASGCQAAIDAERWLVTGEWLGVPAPSASAALL